ncbi:MlaE family ABC transporter permease [Desulfopila inferna]|uniref:MlaE family ABC transporter permease n=1 Tax=Desulfopila inferna TaxID=468528 RepID=UPI0019669E2C|nr:ABC transporter permease [Desulfopila inferna]MBM9604706.1 ABC transporter permease [Desulfopila inferna]
MTTSIFEIDTAPDDTLRLTLAGEWKLGNVQPSAQGLLEQLEERKVNRVTFDTNELDDWDSMLLVFITRISEACSRHKVSMDQSGLPAGVRRLMVLSSPENQRTGIAHGAERQPFLARIGGITLELAASVQEALAFIGEVTLALFRLLRGRAGYRRIDLILNIQEAGVQALPIITLISLLIGMILAFIAAIQLKLFGAQIYVADVVGIGTVRVMGAVMAGVIMAGRTGAAYAAQIGTMQVNEEVDALQTLGLSPIEFLVLPRVLALTLMMPLLCVYADLMGVLGGMTVGVGVLNLGAVEYMNQTRAAISLTDFSVGLFHSFVFGILIAVSGCLRGIKCEGSASAVGNAATSAVVTAIVAMVVATLIITLSCQVLGI